MSNKIKDINIKKPQILLFWWYYQIFFFKPNKIKIDEKSCKNILIYNIGYVKITDLKYVKINSVNHLHIIINNVRRYFEEINKNKCLTLVPTNECIEKIKEYEELWSKIRDLIKLKTKNSDDYDEKYMKTKFNLDDELPIKTIEISSIIINIRAVFHENNKYYLQVFSDIWIYKLWVI